MAYRTAPVNLGHRGWHRDDVNSLLEAFYGTTRFMASSTTATTMDLATTFTLGVTTTSLDATAAIGLADDISLELGTDDDSVIRHKSGTLAANTTLTDVLTGTPVSAALAANSLMISNNTANGDLAAYVNTGTVSEQALFVDASAKLFAIGQTGWSVNVLEGAVKLTLGTETAFGTTQPTNTLVFKTGTAPAGTITTSCGIFTDGTTLKKIIAANTVSDIQT